MHNNYLEVSAVFFACELIAGLCLPFTIIALGTIYWICRNFYAHFYLIEPK